MNPKALEKGSIFCAVISSSLTWGK
jgi:hypothetical protein